MKFQKSLLIAGSALAALMASNSALAQSTATQTSDGTDVTTVVVKNSRRGLGLTNKETGDKAKTTISNEVLSLDMAGQAFTETLNLVPGYLSTNNDAYGSSGSDLSIRGLEGERISLTFDGIQLNDSGNYAIYTNQMIEGELISEAYVQTGATDVDSMTASATGGTINVNTIKPSQDFGGVVKLSVGEEDRRYGFVKIETGRFGPYGTRAFFAYTSDQYDTWMVETSSQPGKIQKSQFNFRVYQDLGDKGSFISLAGHYNENRNRIYFDNTKNSLLNAPGGLNRVVNGAGNDRPNPSNTGNARFQSRFFVTEKLTVTADAAFQYVLANGGGSATINENDARLCGINFGTAGCGADLNFDTDRTDTGLRFFTPSNTKTHRWSFTGSALYKVADSHSVRLGYSFDRANHRQSGEWGRLDAAGAPINVFGGKDTISNQIFTQDGSIIRGRDRFSEADVDVWSIEYRGRFFDDALAVSIGLRNQKMERNLNQYCYSLTNGTGNVRCTTEASTLVTTTPAGIRIVTLASQGATQYIAPYARTVEIDQTQPNLGLTYRINEKNQLFAAYSEALSAPRTDNYYNVAFQTGTFFLAEPTPESSKTMEAGYRYYGSTLSATAVVFSARDEDRIVRAYDDVNSISLDRNVGKVNRDGAEVSFVFKPFTALTIDGAASYLKAEYQNDIVTGATTTIATKGKTLVETPEWMYNLNVRYDFNDRLSANIFGKQVGKRFSNDINTESAPLYTVWNGNVRYKLPMLKSGTYLQLNVVNIFDEKYFSGIRSSATGLAGFKVGAPRTTSLTLRTQF
jgi:iron complex outermembrane receptor protein